MLIELLLGLVLGQSIGSPWHAQHGRAFLANGIGISPQRARSTEPKSARIERVTWDEPLGISNRIRNEGQDLQSASRGVRTPMNPHEARLHLELAYHEVVGSSPNNKTLSLLVAQWALETGRGKSMWGFNFGGLKAKSGGALLDTRESFGAGARLVTQRFRTYPSAIEGARDYVQTLALDFPRAFAALHSGNAPRFVHALAEEGYFTGNPDEYGRAVQLLAIEYERKWLVDADALHR